MPTLPDEKVHRYNAILLERLGVFLNGTPDFLDSDIVEPIVTQCGVSKRYAFSVSLAASLGLDTEAYTDHREIFDNYFPQMVHHLDAATYTEDPFYKNIRIPNTKVGQWEFKQKHYKPYEAFVCNDLEELPDGRVIPQIGFFERDFPYPAVLENDHEWMLITPNEIETMKPAVSAATGNVLTYGLGLGYFAYLVSEKANVSSVTVVEKDPNVIQLFEENVLPQFTQASKLHIVNDDAFLYAEKRMAKGQFDFVFTDLWHDPSDGVELYLRMKSYERYSPQSSFKYWIEKTLRYYC